MVTHVCGAQTVGQQILLSLAVRVCHLSCIMISQIHATFVLGCAYVISFCIVISQILASFVLSCAYVISFCIVISQILATFVLSCAYILHVV